MTFYEIESAILNCVDENGEVIDVDRLNALEMERDKKISDIGCWIKELNAEAAAIKNEKQNLEKRQKSAENKAESLKNFLKNYLNGQKYKDARVAISFRKSVSVKLADDFDPYSIPDDYLRVKLEPDKTAIKEALTEGKQLYGCSLEENTSVIIK